jgi:hypothetical protein
MQTTGTQATTQATTTGTITNTQATTQQQLSTNGARDTGAKTRAASPSTNDAFITETTQQPALPTNGAHNTEQALPQPIDDAAVDAPNSAAVDIPGGAAVDIPGGAAVGAPSDVVVDVPGNARNAANAEGSTALSLVCLPLALIRNVLSLIKLASPTLPDIISRTPMDLLRVKLVNLPSTTLPTMPVTIRDRRQCNLRVL